MKILMLTPYLPYPPSSGGQVRSYNLIKYLAKSNEITLFSLIKNESERKNISELEKYCKKVMVFNRPAKPWTLKNILRTGFSFYPFVVIRNLSGDEKKALVEELNKEKYDLIHAETFYVVPHLPKTTIPVVLVDQTIEYEVYRHYVKHESKWFLKPLLYIDVFKIKYCELKFWRQAKRVVAVSEADKKKMLALDSTLRVDVVPNGAGEDLMAIWQKRETTKMPIIFFQANFTWMQNIEAARNLAKNVFPLIRKIFPDAICRIVGQEASGKIGNLNGNGVEIIDLSTADIKGVIDAYREASVFVAPLEGPGGTRLKILAAMAAGVPVVSSRVGIEGIDARNGSEVLIADTWSDMAEKAALLIKDKKFYQKIIENARKLVEAKYSYESIAGILDKIYREVGRG